MDWQEQWNADAKLISQPDGHGQGTQPRVIPKETIQIMATKDIVWPSVANQSAKLWNHLEELTLEMWRLWIR